MYQHFYNPKCWTTYIKLTSPDMACDQLKVSPFYRITAVPAVKVAYTH